jgi:hypothetical protein
MGSSKEINLRLNTALLIMALFGKAAVSNNIIILPRNVHLFELPPQFINA